MKASAWKFLALVAVVGLLATPIVAMAETIHANPDGYQVVPTQNSPGTATFRAKVDRKAQTIEYTLMWQNLRGAITQSHIHFGRRATDGDIVLFLCTNKGNSPTAPLCFDPTQGSDGKSGMVKFTAKAEDLVALPFGTGDPVPIVKPGDQLLPFANFDEFADAIEAGATYVVVHTTAQPPGELRGQIPAEGRASR